MTNRWKALAAEYDRLADEAERLGKTDGMVSATELGRAIGKVDAYQHAARMIRAALAVDDDKVEGDPNRAKVIAWLDAGNESTIDYIAEKTGVPVLDVLVVINEEAQAKRVEAVGASPLWRRTLPE